MLIKWSYKFPLPLNYVKYLFYNGYHIFNMKLNLYTHVSLFFGIALGVITKRTTYH